MQTLMLNLMAALLGHVWTNDERALLTRWHWSLRGAGTVRYVPRGITATPDYVARQKALQPAPRTYGLYSRPNTTMGTVSAHNAAQRRTRGRTAHTLTRGQLWTVRLVRDAAVREALAARDALGVAASLPRTLTLYKESPEALAARMNGSTHTNGKTAMARRAWRAWDSEARTNSGLVSARDARYSERGASGIRGVRGVAARVSLRDAHMPPSMLTAMPVVGVATHPAATGSDYDALIGHVRRYPRHATLRRMMPGPHGYTTVPACNRVMPVAAYVTLQRASRDARHTATPDALAARDAARVALLTACGTVGNTPDA
jgi:hypothetical protein